MRNPVQSVSPTWTGRAHGSQTARCRANERTRWFMSRVVAAVGVMALLSLVSTPVQRVLNGELGGRGLLGPLTAAASVGFWSLGLLLVARGLRHGHRLAWGLTLLAVVTALWVHLTRLDDPVDTVLLCAGLTWLLLRRQAFAVPFSQAELAKSLGMVAGAGLLMLSAPAVPPGFGEGVVANALVAAAMLAFVGALWALMSPSAVEQRTDLQRHLERARAREVVTAHGHGTLDYFALRDDKRWFFHADSVVAYAVRFGVCLVSPDPIGPVHERREVWAAFTEHARSRGWSISILGADAEWLELYRSFGLRPVYLGDEAIVDCSAFSLEGRAMRGLRQACNRVERAGYTVSFHDPIALDPVTRRELLAVSATSRVGAVERGFSMTLGRLFDPEDTGLLLSLTRDPEGRACAFIQWMPAPGIKGWSLDVMRHETGPGVPNGVMDHLIVETIWHLRDRGEVGLGLNFAVIRSLVDTEASTAWGRVGQSLLHTLSGRSDVASLCRFNQKFTPSWRPRYVVLGSLDTVACQGLVIAAAEGLSELPVIGRFLRGIDR